MQTGLYDMSSDHAWRNSRALVGVWEACSHAAGRCTCLYTWEVTESVEAWNISTLIFFFLPSYTWQITGGKWAGWSKLSTHGKLQKLLGAVHCWFWAFDSKKNIEYHQPYPLTRNWNLIQMGLKWKLKTTMTEWLWNKTLLRHSSDQNILHQKLNCALVSVRT